MLEQYLVTALWSSLNWDNQDENGNPEPLDNDYDVIDFSEKARSRSALECKLFCKKAGTLLEGLDLEQVGHDFWLTRNGHGAGFWDGDYEKELGDKLTAIAKEFPEINIYVGDDNKLYFEEG